MVGSFYGLINEKKVQRALKMLQTESFQLYSQVGDDNLCGIVKSQTQVDTVYAPWIHASGQYGCYSQDLSECMGLQGSVCKHLLVLLLGLARSGEFEMTKAMLWMQAAASKKPKLNDELSTEALLHYRGVMAGEVDWRAD